MQCRNHSTWIDGRPIRREVIRITRLEMAQKALSGFDISYMNIDTVVDIHSITERTCDDGRYTEPDSMDIYIRNNADLFVCARGYNIFNPPEGLICCTVIIEYTRKQRVMQTNRRSRRR